MRTSPEAVYVIIPCMKELGMSWSEIKRTPRHELSGLLVAVSNYNAMHSFDGYSSEEIGNLSKDKPEIRSQYNRAMELKAKYEMRAGKKSQVKSFRGLFG